MVHKWAKTIYTHIMVGVGIVRAWTQGLNHVSIKASECWFVWTTRLIIFLLRSIRNISAINTMVLDKLKIIVHKIVVNCSLQSLQIIAKKVAIQVFIFYKKKKRWMKFIWIFIHQNPEIHQQYSTFIDICQQTNARN